MMNNSSQLAGISFDMIIIDDIVNLNEGREGMKLGIAEFEEIKKILGPREGCELFTGI